MRAVDLPIFVYQTDLDDLKSPLSEQTRPIILDSLEESEGQFDAPQCALDLSKVVCTSSTQILSS